MVCLLLYFALKRTKFINDVLKMLLIDIYASLVDSTYRLLEVIEIFLKKLDLII